MKNLRKKFEYLKGELNEDVDCTESSGSDNESEEEVKEVKKRPIKQRAGVSAEVFGENNKKGDFKPPVIAKSEETKTKLRTRLLQAFMFNALEEGELKVVIDAIEEVKATPGTEIITQGDAGDCMYVLEAGSLECTKIFKPGDAPTKLKTYVPGEGFGELALLYNAPRAATITATVDSTVWKLDRGTFNHIVKDAAQRKREKYDSFLQSVPILQSVDPYERSKLGDAVKEEKFKKQDYIIRQGQSGDKFYFINSGTAIATKNVPGSSEETKVMDYESGAYFGERALLTNDVRAANIIATADEVVCLTLERDIFVRLLGPLDEILKRNMEQYKKYA